MKKNKLFVTVLAGLLVFGPVMTTTAAEPVSGEVIAAVGETTQYEGDKTKYQKLIDAMIAAVENDAFGKPAYTWTVPDLTDFVNKKFPNMKKEESESDITWKSGEVTKEKRVTYYGSSGNTHGFIEKIDVGLPEGISDSKNIAGYGISSDDVETIHRIEADDDVYSTGEIAGLIVYYDQKALAKLSTLDGALSMIDDPDLVTYMKKEKEYKNSREYNFPDGTSLTFTPNGVWGSDDKGELDKVMTYISYTFRNHNIVLHYLDGTTDLVEYGTHFTPTDMYRLYNPNSGEHFYTADRTEADNLVTAGWKDEGLGWKAPKMSDTPVYRLYNPNSGDHHYTPDETERNNLITAGWNDEGIGWYSFERQTTSLYRLYNPNAESGSHHYTTDKDERDYLVSTGWIDEGIGWYGM